MLGFSAAFVWDFYFILTFVLTLMECIKLMSVREIEYKKNKNLSITGLLLTLFLIFFLGLRPEDGKVFFDMRMYAWSYNTNFTSSDPFFNFLSHFFNNLGVSVTGWFLFIETVYIGCTYLAVTKLFKSYQYVALLFLYTAYPFVTFATNGLRNGMAASIMLLSFSYLITRKPKDIIMGIVLGLASVGTHKAMLLPFGCSLLSLFVIKRFRTAIIIYMISIVISLVLGGAISEIVSALAVLSEDEKMYAYLNPGETYQDKVGFRWDFLLYSVVPIILGYFVEKKEGKLNKRYNYLLNTYILANSFWVIVIRAYQSNRFAYLSWFIYGLVLSYPLIKGNWEKKNNKIALALFGQEAFTMLMFLLTYK